MTKDEKTQWAIAQYQAGDSVRAICEALNITSPTFYRWTRDQLEPRQPARWNLTDTPNYARSKSAIQAWQKRFETKDPMQRTIQRSKNLSLLDILNKLQLSLSLDNLGHFLVHAGSDKKLYLTETEFKELSKKPIETLKHMALRINATFRKEGRQ